MPLQPPDFTPIRRSRSSPPLSARSFCRCDSAASVSVIGGGGLAVAGLPAEGDKDAA